MSPKYFTQWSIAEMLWPLLFRSLFFPLSSWPPPPPPVSLSSRKLTEQRPLSGAASQHSLHHTNAQGAREREKRGKEMHESPKDVDDSEKRREET